MKRNPVSVGNLLWQNLRTALLDFFKMSGTVYYSIEFYAIVAEQSLDITLGTERRSIDPYFVS